jgi:hypothetical protein
MNDYKPSIPKSMQLKSTPTMTKPHHDEKMEVDTDLNDDEPPPKIECEGHADRESGWFFRYSFFNKKVTQKRVKCFLYLFFEVPATFRFKSKQFY